MTEEQALQFLEGLKHHDSKINEIPVRDVTEEDFNACMDAIFTEEFTEEIRLRMKAKNKSAQIDTGKAHDLTKEDVEKD